MEAESEEKNNSQQAAVVIDFGKRTCKAGFAGESAPKAIFPSVVDRPRSPNILVGMDYKACYISLEAMRLRGVLRLKWWFDYGMRIVTNFDDVERIWHHIFYNEIRVLPEDTVVIVTRQPLNPKANSERMVQIMFETFNIQALYVAVDAILALFCSGRTTGVVVDCGDFCTNVVPIYNGHVLAHAVKLGGIGGEQLTDYLTSLLKYIGYHSTSYTRDIDCDIKERLGYVALDFETEMQSAREESQEAGDDAKKDSETLECQATQQETIGQGELTVFDIAGNLVWQGVANRSQQISALLDEIGAEKEVGCCKHLIFGGALAKGTHPVGSYLKSDEKAEATLVIKKFITREYELPDGNRVSICGQQFQCAELLFQPDLAGYDKDGIHQMVCKSIAQCNDDLQATLFSNIVLAGGSASFPGIKERLTKELKSSTSSSGMVCVTSASNPALSTWFGGSMLASLSIFRRMCITREAYAELGPEIVHKHDVLHGEIIEALNRQVADQMRA